MFDPRPPVNRPQAHVGSPAVGFVDDSPDGSRELLSLAVWADGRDVESFLERMAVAWLKQTLIGALVDEVWRTSLSLGLPGGGPQDPNARWTKASQATIVALEVELEAFAITPEYEGGTPSKVVPDHLNKTEAGLVGGIDRDGRRVTEAVLWQRDVDIASQGR
jgi:hypothetical protein